MIRSTFMGFEAAKSSIFANQKSLDIVGNNLANSETSGYTRQRVDRASAYVQAHATRIASSTVGVAGQGVNTLGVSQVRDAFLDKCFREEYSLSSYHGQTSELQNDILNIFPEAADITDSSGILGGLEKIYQGLNKYIQAPTLDSEANIVRSAFTNMTQVLQQMDKRLTEVTIRQTEDLSSTLLRTNDILSQIAHINKKIAADCTVLANPDSQYFVPNELADQRNLLLDELAGYGNINVKQNSNGTINVEMFGHLVVDRGESDAITMSTKNNGYVSISWRSSGKDVIDSESSTGAIKAYASVLNGRGANVQSNDETSVQGIPYYRDAINLFAAELVKVANNTIPVADKDGKPSVDADGNIIYKTLLAAKQADGTTNSKAPITAANIAISDEWIQGGSGYFIYSRDENVENYAQQLSAKLNEQDAVFDSYGESFTGTFRDFTVDLVGRIGSDVGFNEGRRAAAATVANDFIQQRDSVSGVQQDEETADMLKYQKSYAAAARVMTTMDDLLDTLINKVGRVGL